MMRANQVGGVLLATLAVTCAAQNLQRRDAPGRRCGPVELRIAAKLQDGSAADLLPADLKVEFNRGTAEVISVTSFAKLRDERGITDILFVVPPYSDFGESTGLKGVMSALEQALGFPFQAAVLGPDGMATSYSDKLSVLGRELHEAAKGSHAISDMRRWVLAERAAFLNLRLRIGRHVIVRLFRGDNLQFPVQRNFMMDDSFDQFASTDLAMIYRLLSPENMELTLPREVADTKTLPGEELEDARTLRLKQQLNLTSRMQAEIWARRNEWGKRTAGGAATDTATLMHDVVRDNAADYDVIVQPQFACDAAGPVGVRVLTTRKDVRVFGPGTALVTPYDAK